MAKVNSNLVMHGLSGKLGEQLVVKGAKGGRTIISAKPNFSSGRTFSTAQLIQQQAFREAAAYGKAMKGEQIYISKADGTALTPYNVAVADWFNRPEILEVNTMAWHGAAGDMIRMRVQDDVRVDQVTVMISDGEGTVLESGQAGEKGALWWEYVTTSDVSGSLTLTVAARDLPGHVAEYSQVRTFS